MELVIAKEAPLWAGDFLVRVENGQGDSITMYAADVRTQNGVTRVVSRDTRYRDVDHDSVIMGEIKFIPTSDRFVFSALHTRESGFLFGLNFWKSFDEFRAADEYSEEVCEYCLDNDKHAWGPYAPPNQDLSVLRSRFADDPLIPITVNYYPAIFAGENGELDMDKVEKLGAR